MHRSRIDIIVDILDVARVATTKTSIVYKTNLNFKLADRYLSSLQGLGLIENRLDKYITTEKGRILLEKAKEVISELTIQEQIPEVKILNFENSKERSLKITGSYPYF